jgi:hypothetical protein
LLFELRAVGSNPIGELVGVSDFDRLPQRRRHLSRVLEALLRTPLQRLHHNRIEVGWNLRVVCARRHDRQIDERAKTLRR